MSLLTHLDCGACRERHEARALQNLCRKCGKPLLARYDMEAAKAMLSKRDWDSGRDDLWRFFDMLPVKDARFIASLGEGMTPLVAGGRLAEEAGLPNLLIKDEGGNPTGSFKARGMTAAVSKARELGVARFGVPSAGNAGAALAAYAARAGAEAEVYLPADTPTPIAREVQMYGARVHLVKGLITDAAKEVQARAAAGELFDVSTLREPYRVEGKKTMGYEIVMQNGWKMPDVVIYPTGGGTGIVGMWKAFGEMETLGFIGPERPRMISVQAEGCAPIVRAFAGGSESAEPWQDAKTEAWGLRVPRAIGDFLILRALRESGGGAIAVSEDAIREAQKDFARIGGIAAAPEGAATLAAARQLADEGAIERGEQVVLFNTGAPWPYWS